MMASSGTEKRAARRQEGSRQRSAATPAAARQETQRSGETIPAWSATKRPTRMGLKAKVLVRPEDWKSRLTQLRSAFQRSTGEKTAAASATPSHGHGEASILRPR